MINSLILITVLVISFVSDVKYRKIFNIITLPSIIFAILYYSVTMGFPGFIFSGRGFLVGLGLLLIPYLMGGIGAGDVKLMAAIGALMGTSFVFYSFLYTAIIGGVIALILIIKTYGIKNTIKTLFLKVFCFKSSMGSMNLSKNKNNSIVFPYGVAIVLGTFCTLFWGGF